MQSYRYIVTIDEQGPLELFVFIGLSAKDPNIYNQSTVMLQKNEFIQLKENFVWN